MNVTCVLYISVPGQHTTVDIRFLLRFVTFHTGFTCVFCVVCFRCYKSWMLPVCCVCHLWCVTEQCLDITLVLYMCFVFQVLYHNSWMLPMCYVCPVLQVLYHYSWMLPLCYVCPIFQVLFSNIWMLPVCLFVAVPGLQVLYSSIWMLPVCLCVAVPGEHTSTDVQVLGLHGHGHAGQSQHAPHCPVLYLNPFSPMWFVSIQSS